jgi:hypothetical protein
MQNLIKKYLAEMRKIKNIGNINFNKSFLHAHRSEYASNQHQLSIHEKQ